VSATGSNIEHSPSQESIMQPESGNLPKSSLSALTIGAIGVVFGDIGTSPLYALQTTFTGTHSLPVVEANVLGVLSVMFWTIMLLVSLKYVVIIMRADNRWPCSP
jgi:KUP system potassium uptake protein